MVTIDSVLMGFFLFVLVLIRCSGIVVFAPFFGSEHLPMTVRIGIAAILALLLYPLAETTALVPSAASEVRLGIPELFFLASQEILIGLVLGFLASFVFLGAQLAGQLVGMQVGYAMANILDPILGTEISILGFFKMNLALLLFLVLNLHLGMIWVLAQSFRLIGIGSLTFPALIQTAQLAGMDQTNAMFIVGIQLAVPVLLIMLLTSVVEGFITRTIPQMNIMVLGLPLRLCLGMIAIFFAMVPICHVLAGRGTVWSVGGEEGEGSLWAMIRALYETLFGLAGM